MSYFPQLGTGATGQFPIVKRRRARTVSNTAMDGHQVKLVDAPAQSTEWRLRFEELTDGEMETLASFFESVEGRLGTFTFLDPAANLLAWSERLDQTVWQAAPFVTVTGEVQDPLGTTRACRVTNAGGAAAQIAQTLQVPDWFRYCLSVYARSEWGSSVTLVRGEEKRAYGVGSEWRRLAAAAQSERKEESVRFGLELPPGAAVEIFGMQVEAQTGASAYKRTLSRGGVYSNARFDDDEFQVTTAGLERHGCELTVIHGECI